jgi:hypothetical protein
MPFDLLWDSGRMASGANAYPVGSAMMLDASVPFAAGPNFTCLGNSTTDLIVRYDSASSIVANPVTNTIPFTFTTNDLVYGSFKVPVIGWDI